LFDGGSVAASGDYVYVVRKGNLYQYAAYDLTLIKRVAINGNRRVNRRGEAGAGGAGGSGAGGGGAGGQGGAGGGAMGYREDVAAAGDFVYVLQGDRIHKFYAEGLTKVKAVKLKQ
jgi:hypothetical protein